MAQLIVLSGLPGTGKSEVADAIGRARRAPVLAVDPIESAILEAGVEASFETGLAAYQVAERVADACLAAGLDVVIDAVNSVEPARDMWRRLAAGTRHASGSSSASWPTRTSTEPGWKRATAAFGWPNRPGSTSSGGALNGRPGRSRT